MGWLCAQCKVPHAEAFDACWQCGAPRAEDAPAVQSLVILAADQDEAPPLSPEEEAVERAALAAAAAFAGGILSALGLAFASFRLGSPAAAQVALYCMLGGAATGLVAAQWAAGREIAAAERGGWEPLEQG